MDCDYLVVGAGSAGCVVAKRLADGDAHAFMRRRVADADAEAEPSSGNFMNKGGALRVIQRQPGVDGRDRRANHHALRHLGHGLTERHVVGHAGTIDAGISPAFNFLGKVERRAPTAGKGDKA